MTPHIKSLALLGILFTSHTHAAETPAPKGVLVPTRVTFGTGSAACPVNPPAKAAESALSIAAPLIASALGKVVSTGTEALSKYIEGATREESAALSVVTTGYYFYQMSRTGGDKWEAKAKFDCLSIVRGTLGNPDPRLLAASASVSDPGSYFRGHDTPNSDFAPLRSLGLADYPEFYLELAIERDTLNTTFRFRPQFLYVRQPRVKVQPGKRFDLNMTLVFSLPGAAAPFAIAPVHFPNLLAGALFSTTQVSTDNPWVLLPRPPDPKTIPASIRGVAASIPVTPFNVTATIEETASPSKFLVLVGQLLSQSSEPLGKAAESSVDEVLKQHDLKDVKPRH